MTYYASAAKTLRQVILGHYPSVRLPKQLPSYAKSLLLNIMLRKVLLEKLT